MEHNLLLSLSTLGASAVLLFGIALLWRRSIPAYISAFRWQSAVLSALFVVVGYFDSDVELYFVAAIFFILKVIIIPSYLLRLYRRVGGGGEVQPYVNYASSLVISGLLVLLAYLITRPVVSISTLPTRGGIPLAVALILVGLFVVVTRRKALTQIVGLLVLENGIAMLAVLGTYGIPLVVELGVFIDVLIGFMAMQVFVYHIHGTFESINVEELNKLKG